MEATHPHGLAPVTVPALWRRPVHQTVLRVSCAAVLIGAVAHPGYGQATVPPASASNQEALASRLVITNAWMRPALAGGSGAAYLTISNRGSVAVRVAAATTRNAAAAEVHMTAVHDGMAHMDMRTGFDIAPGARVVLAPGGLHYMLVRLHQALLAGDTAVLSLTIQRIVSPTSAKRALTRPERTGAAAAGTLRVAVPVRAP